VKPRILVIDDESAIRDSLKMTLEYDGYDVMLAATGEEGVKLIEREAPDLVFSTSRCRHGRPRSAAEAAALVEVTPVVVISGHADINTRSKRPSSAPLISSRSRSSASACS
jgi:DNA-binding NtrC family response regulator